MKILFLFADENHCDYACDGVYIGLKNLKHIVDAIPLPMALYKAKPEHFYSRVNGFFKNYFNYEPLYSHLKTDYDAIFMESAGVPYKCFPFYKNNDAFDKLLKSDIPKCCLLGNDTFTYQPLPNVRYDYKCKMAIREKQFQTPLVNVPYINDFPLHFTVPQNWIKYIPEKERTKDIFFSMSPSNSARQDIATYLPLQHYETLSGYINAIREHKYGISVYGDGYTCQRDAEIGGNSLLCLYKHPKWKGESGYYSENNAIYFNDYTDLKRQVSDIERKGEYEEYLKRCYTFTEQNLTCEAQAEKLLEWTIHEG